MDNLYYYTYDAETKTIKPKFLEGGHSAKTSHPNDIILGMEFYAPEKTYAEQCAANYNKQLVKNITELENADDHAIYIEICKDCGRAFAINKEEYKWFSSRELIPPKRCKQCRIKRKAQRASEENKENK